MIFIKRLIGFILLIFVVSPSIFFWLDKIDWYFKSKEINQSYQEFKNKSTPEMLSHEQQNHDFDSWGVWFALNNYREANGLPILKINSKLCTIASIRLIEQKRNGQLDLHDGFSEIVKKYPPNLITVEEELAEAPSTFTGKEVIMGFATSMGHDLGLRNKDAKHGCTARNNKFTVIILGSNSRSGD